MTHGDFADLTCDLFHEVDSENPVEGRGPRGSLI